MMRAARHVAHLAAQDDFDGWRAGVRAAHAAGVAPAEVSWVVGDAPGDLLTAMTDASVPAAHDGAAAPLLRVPRSFVTLARSVICHRDPERFGMLHRAVAAVSDRPGWIHDHADPLHARLQRMAQGVRRDMHKMRAFVRFREVAAPDIPTKMFVAWFEPAHFILRANARFFVERFTAMHWTVLTPDGSLTWDGDRLTEGPPATRGDAPAGDPVEDAWKRYYAAIFNPARVKVQAMMREMPRKYWANMPETALIPDLLSHAQARTAAMIEAAPLP